MVLKYVDGKITDFEAAAAISEGQVVELIADRKVQPTAGASSKVVGVALTSGDAGKKISVVHKGIVEVTASGAIAAGDKVQAAADGKAAKFAATKTYTDSAGNTVDVDDATKIIGVALKAAADGEKVEILLTL